MKEIQRLFLTLFHEIHHDLLYIRSAARQIRLLRKKDQLTDAELYRILDGIDTTTIRMSDQIEIISTRGLDSLFRDKE